MITNLVIFAFISGALLGLVIVGAVVWSKHLKLKMTWWKWLLTALWYLTLNFFILLDFTLIGEGESRAGLKMLLIQLLIMLVLGVGLFRLLGKDREKTVV